MKEIELNPNGTFPRKYSKPEYASYTTTTATDPDFISTPPKKKDWKKELIDTLLFTATMWCLVNGISILIIVIVQLVIWLIKLF